MGKRDQNPFLGTFTFHCGDLPPENIPEAVAVLLNIKRTFSVIQGRKIGH